MELIGLTQGPLISFLWAETGHSIKGEEVIVTPIPHFHLLMKTMRCHSEKAKRWTFSWDEMRFFHTSRAF